MGLTNVEPTMQDHAFIADIASGLHLVTKAGHTLYNRRKISNHIDLDYSSLFCGAVATWLLEIDRNVPGTIAGVMKTIEEHLKRTGGDAVG
jgi:hypothetical protein